MIKQTVTVIDRGLFKRLRKAPEIYAKETRTVMETILAYILRLVQHFTPRGATGLLQKDMYSEIWGSPTGLRGKVASGLTTASYAEAVEEGTKPHWAPIEPLELWARRVIGETYPGEALEIAYAVRWMIHKWGTKGHFMFKKAFRGSRGFVKIQKEILARKIAGKLERS